VGGILKAIVRKLQPSSELSRFHDKLRHNDVALPAQSDYVVSPCPTVPTPPTSPSLEVAWAAERLDPAEGDPHAHVMHLG